MSSIPNPTTGRGGARPLRRSRQDTTFPPRWSGRYSVVNKRRHSVAGSDPLVEQSAVIISRFPLSHWLDFLVRHQGARRNPHHKFLLLSVQLAFSGVPLSRGTRARVTRHNLQYEMKAHSRQALSKVPLSQVRPYVASHLLASNKQTRRYTAYSTCHFD